MSAKSPNNKPAYPGEAKEPIAVIGIGCRFPGRVNSPESFWQLLCNEVDAISEIPRDRIDLETYYDPQPATPGKMMTRWGGFLEQIDQFDAYFFGISPREAERLDPQQRLLLETAWEAIEDAGQVVDKLAGSQTGVFIGLWLNDYEARLFADPALVDFYMTTGSGRYSASGRISYALGFQGPSLTIDTACSSSLVAVHLACQSLWSGECSLALAGGANTILQPHISIAYSQSKMMAPDGHCKFGDASADGYVRSEGAGIVVLKPLSQAVADGDPIYAVIRGSAVNNDGRSSGFLATPGQQGQEAMLRKAYQDARVSPDQVQYIEAHGTGTRAGDPVELGALGAVLAPNRPKDQPCLVGSVKTNFGHTEGAAGIAGLIKVALSLHHRVIPASLHLQELNPNIPWQKLGLTISNKLTPWPAETGRGIAGVSAFGIAGTNAHVVLAEAPIFDSSETEIVTRGAYLLPLSAHTPKALADLAQAYQTQLTTTESFSLADLCYSASCRRSHQAYRLALVAQNQQELAKQLTNFVQEGEPSGSKEAHPAAKIVFVFPGQGSQWPGMGRDLLAREPVFRQMLEQCETAMHSYVDWSLLEQLAADETASNYRLNEIDVIQPTLLSIEIALAVLWRSWGVEPDAVIGHSMGEVAAAYIAGALSLEEAMRIICRRSQLLKRTSGQGAMAVVGLSLEQAEKSLNGYHDRLSVAVSNSHRSTVLSGDPIALEELLDQLKAQNIFCRPIKVDVASHSPQMDLLKDDLLRVLEGLQPKTTQIPLYSTATGEVSDGTNLDAAYWVRNLRQPVLFAPMVQQLLAADHTLFIEMSPHPLLLTAIEETFQHVGRAGYALASLRRDQDEQEMMLSALGQLYILGYTVDWPRLYPAGGRSIALPQYPWQRRHFWLETAAAGSKNQGSWLTQNSEFHPLLGYRLPQLAHLPESHIWQNKPDNRFRAYIQRLPFEEMPKHIYGEMALAAVAAIFGEKTHTLAELICREPFSATPESTLQLVLTTQNNGLALFQIFSRNSASEPWQQHATGKVEIGQIDVSWFYNLTWQPQLPAQTPVNQANENATWLIFADRQGIGAALSGLLAEQGQNSTLIFSGETYVSSGAETFQVNPAQPADFQRLLAEVLNTSETHCRGIVYLWAIDQVETPTTPVSPQTQAYISGSVLHLVQGLLQEQRLRSCPLWLITQKAQPVEQIPTELAVAQSPLWGLGRVIALEQPELWGGLIDLDIATAEQNAQILLAEILGPGPEDQLAFRDGQRYVARLAQQSPQFLLEPIPLRTDSTYLITGGLGGLGLKVAQWLVSQGVRHLALMGRRPPTEPTNEVLQEMTQAGIQVVALQGDVSQLEQLKRVLTEIDQTMPPLRGVIHAAGLLDDGVLARQTWDRFAKVLAPKVEGAWNLHTLTQARPLDCFVLFSSVTALLGTPGQGNYAAANAFLDSLAHSRRAQGLPALSINWGTWAEVGLAAQNERTDKFARRGLEAMSPEEGIAALAYLFRQNIAQSAVMPMDWATYLAQMPPDSRKMWLAEVAKTVETSAETTQEPTQKSDILEKLKIVTANEQYELLSNYVRGQVATVLHFDRSYPLEPGQGFFQLGMDSLMAMQLRNRLQTNLKCALSSTLAFDYPTIATLTQHLLNELLPKEVPAAPEPEVDESLIELEDLSRDELKALLDQELLSIDEEI